MNNYSELFSVPVFQKNIMNEDDLLNRYLIQKCEYLHIKAMERKEIYSQWVGNTFTTHGVRNYPNTKKGFKNLESMVLEETKLFTESTWKTSTFHIQQYWFNISSYGNYQEFHNHPKCDIVGIYYPKLPENGGNLILRNPSSYNQTDLRALFGKRDDLTEQFHVNAKSGDLLLFPSYIDHMVTENKNPDETRISISFNIDIN